MRRIGGYSKTTKAVHGMREALGAAEKAPGKAAAGLKETPDAVKKGARVAKRWAWDFKWVARDYDSVGRRNPRMVKPMVAMVVALLFLVGLLGFLLVQDVVSSGTIFKGIEIDGHSVGGMSKSEALEMVQRDIAAPLYAPITVTYGDKKFTLDPKSIDFKVDSQRMVEDAYWAGQGRFLLSRMFRRLALRPVDEDIPVEFTYSDKKLKGFLNDVAKQVNYEPQDAYVKVDGVQPVIVKAKDGLAVDGSATYRSIISALSKKPREVAVTAIPVKPKFTDDKISDIIVISLSQHELYLFNRETEQASYLIACGMPQYPTPPGRYHITFKEKNPTWLPTSEWARDKQGVPQPPGPDNPLGKYWFDIGAGLGIHGTPFEKTLGSDASHGCIRMSNWAAGELYEKVDVGTPVIIIK